MRMGENGQALLRIGGGGTMGRCRRRRRAYSRVHHHYVGASARRRCRAIFTMGSSRGFLMISSHIFVVQNKVFRQFFRQNKGGKEQALYFGFQVCLLWSLDGVRETGIN